MKLNKRIIKVMSVVCSLFLITIIYLTYFITFKAKSIANSGYNVARMNHKEEQVLRGNIYDRNGELLAETKKTENGQKRFYPYGSLFAHTIGYSNKQYGKSGLELSFNKYLLKKESVIDVLKKNEKNGKSVHNGANLSLTLDKGMTELAAEKLKGASGSVVVLSPITGEVFCCYSNPSFDPNDNSLKENWSTIAEDESTPLVFRATQGLYAPGSTFKIVTAAAGIEGGLSEFITDDMGKIEIDGKTYKNAYGSTYRNMDMKKAIAKSSNVYFASLSEELDREMLQKKADDFFVNKSVNFDIPNKTRKIDFSKTDDAEFAATCIGQGKLLVTPLNMALVACAVANNGQIMRPYMVEKAYHNNKKNVYSAMPDVLSQAIDGETASMLTDYMTECVRSGTGTRAAVRHMKVAAKTGTAENEKEGKTHAWIICFAPADNPQIAMCIMEEYCGSGGGSVCAPIARSIIEYAKQSGLIE